MVEVDNHSSSTKYKLSAAPAPKTQKPTTNVFALNYIKTDWSVTLDMNSTHVTFKIEIGAQGRMSYQSTSFIPSHLLQNSNLPPCNFLPIMVDPSLLLANASPESNTRFKQFLSFL